MSDTIRNIVQSGWPTALVLYLGFVGYQLFDMNSRLKELETVQTTLSDGVEALRTEVIPGYKVAAAYQANFGQIHSALLMSKKYVDEFGSDARSAYLIYADDGVVLPYVIEMSQQFEKNDLKNMLVQLKQLGESTLTVEKVIELGKEIDQIYTTPTSLDAKLSLLFYKEPNILVAEPLKNRFSAQPEIEASAFERWGDLSNQLKDAKWFNKRGL